ncbi:MAG: hypothetical protein KDJ90_12630 [Nitratireductor sp.]|nr:hypothetical protein [Nitratireductor sp.]
MIDRRPKRITVSDHAVLRWLERVEGVDVKAIRRRIGRAVRNASEHGAAGARLDGVGFCLQYRDDGEAVVTTTVSHHVRSHLAEKRKTGGTP